MKISLLILLFIALRVQAQPCNSHDDCSDALVNCTMWLCNGTTCVRGPCQDLAPLPDCRDFTGQCGPNRRCLYEIPCCCAARNFSVQKKETCARKQKREVDARCEREQHSLSRKRRRITQIKINRNIF